MKRNISEELPARKFAPAAVNSSPDDSKKEKSSQSDPAKKAKQAVYDIRYRARREDIPLLQAFSQYMQNSSLGEQDRAMIKAKLFGKDGGGMKAEDFRPLFMEAASESISNALYKVFVKESNQEQEQIQLTYVEELQSTEDRKYQVKVTDKNSGKTYVRLATREKISQLRLNPNISEVEIISIDPDVQTGYGSPYEGERKRGEQTAAVTSGKGLKDYDGDGKVESGAKEYRGAVHNAIQRKKGGTPDGKDTSSVKEDYLYEAGKKKIKKFDVMPPGKKNTITIGSKEGGSPDGGIINAHTELHGTVIVETGYSKFLKIVSSGKGEKEKLNPAKVDMDGPQVGCDDPDPRSMKTASNLVKTKLRLMGLRPLMMSNESEGNQIDEFFGPDKVVPKGGQASGSRNPVEVGRDYVAQSGGKPAVVNYDKAGSKTVRAFTQQDNMNRRKNTLAQNAAAAAQGLSPLYNVKNSYEPEGDQLDEIAPLVAAGLAAGAALAGGAVIKRAQDAAKSGVDAAKKGQKIKPGIGIGNAAYGMQKHNDATRDAIKMYNSYEPEGEMVDEARAEEKRGLGSTGAKRQRQTKGVVTPYGEIAHPVTSYSGGQNPQLRGKGGNTKEQRRAASRRYVDQPGGIYAEPENQQGAGRYADKQARKRPDLGSRFD